MKREKKKPKRKVEDVGDVEGKYKIPTSLCWDYVNYVETTHRSVRNCEGTFLTFTLMVVNLPSLCIFRTVKTDQENLASRRSTEDLVIKTLGSNHDILWVSYTSIGSETGSAQDGKVVEACPWYEPWSADVD